MTKKDTPRSCGECSECCTVTNVYSDSPFNREHPDVPIWFKPMRKTCQFVVPSGGGCSIFNSKCPTICREYTCEWLAGAPIRKPTESKVVFFAERANREVAIMVGARTDEAYEDEKVKEEIQYYREKGFPVLLMHDDGERTLIE